jgi:glycine/serine hydroxymethyltransferase
MKEEDVAVVADLIHEALLAREDEAKLAEVKEKVLAFNAAFPLPW